MDGLINDRHAEFVLNFYNCCLQFCLALPNVEKNCFGISSLNARNEPRQKKQFKKKNSSRFTLDQEI